MANKAFHMKMNYDFSGLKKLERKSPALFQKSMERGAMQFLTWCNTGSGGSKSSAKPPIRFGVLRGSSSAFVNGKFVGVFPQNVQAGAPESPDPNKSHKGKGIVVGWNTAYAARMHEDLDYTVSRDGGPKWIEKHLDADRDNLMEFIANDMGKALK